MRKSESPTADYLHVEAGEEPNLASRYLCFSDYATEVLEQKKHAFDLAREAKRESRRYWVQACYISLGAIAGVFFRMALAQLFGENCKNPGTIGWLSSGAPLCVTANGETLQEGGVLYADLPANMLGSFLMGLFQDGIVLGLSLPLPIAWLSPQHPFQRMTILHTAFKTGFCGSLTTFSSWNSAMIVLIYGTGSNLPTQIWLAILGYIVGMETAMGSFVCGKSVARFLHRKVNPVLALEAHAVQDRKEEGVYIHWELPDFERRFLALIDVADEQAHFNLSKSVEYLETWRRSTVDARRVRHCLLPHLNAIEEAVLIHHEAIPSESEAVAREQGWEVDALLHWAMDDEHGEPTKRHSSFLNPDSSRPNEVSRWLTLPVAAFLFWTVMFGLFTALILLKEEEDTVVTYRTMAYAMFLAPFGALCRWKLSEFNGKLPNYSWFPFGTFLANISGSILSILAVSIEYYMDTKMFYPGKFNFWGIGTIRATRIGFAGCLTTVSTFVSEIHGFMQAHTDTAYPYIMTTISVACAIGSIIYGIVVYAI